VSSVSSTSSVPVVPVLPVYRSGNVSITRSTVYTSQSNGPIRSQYPIVTLQYYSNYLFNSMYSSYSISNNYLFNPMYRSYSDLPTDSIRYQQLPIPVRSSVSSNGFLKHCTIPDLIPEHGRGYQFQWLILCILPTFPSLQLSNQF